METLALEVYTDMMEEFEDLAETLFYFPLPIQAVNGVPCRAGLILKRDGHARLNVYPRNIAYFDEDGDPGNLIYFRHRFEKVDDFSKYTPEYLEAILLSANQILSTLKFNRLLGRFQQMTPGIQDLRSFGSENVQTNLKECRTCGETTRCKTNCSCSAQYLCFVCWDDIQPVREERFGELNWLQRCPGCNEELAFSRHLQW